MRFVALFLFLTSSCSAGEMVLYETVVTPLPNEDIASDCHYTLKIPAPGHRIRACMGHF